MQVVKLARGDVYQLSDGSLAYITTAADGPTVVVLIGGHPAPVARSVLTPDRYRGNVSEADLAAMLRRRIK
jgi:hypothetical protein